MFWYQKTVGCLSADSWPPVCRLLVDCWLVVDRLFTDSQPCVSNCLLTVSQQICRGAILLFLFFCYCIVHLPFVYCSCQGDTSFFLFFYMYIIITKGLIALSNFKYESSTCVCIVSVWGELVSGVVIIGGILFCVKIGWAC